MYLYLKKFPFVLHAFMKAEERIGKNIVLITSNVQRRDSSPWISLCILCKTIVFSHVNIWYEHKPEVIKKNKNKRVKYSGTK